MDINLRMASNAQLHHLAWLCPTTVLQTSGGFARMFWHEREREREQKGLGTVA